MLLSLSTDDQPFVPRTGVIHCLIRHAGRDGSVSDDRHDVAPLGLQIPGHCHSQGGRNGSRRMRSAERIVLAFGPLGET